jgi:histidinol-phosphate phosphatase family protein
MIRAVLFDRDGTLIADTPDKHERLNVMPLANRAVQRLREHNIRIGVVTNQPALARGTLRENELRDLHRRIERQVGAIDGWFVCPHPESASCICRKPEPGLILQAAQQFGVAPHECAVIGDIGSDVEAAESAGARGVLVPTPVTLPEEVARAPVVCSNLLDAVDYLLEEEESGAA